MMRHYEHQKLEYAMSEAPAKEESMAPRTKNGIVKNASFVNLRDKPSKKGKILETAKRGDRLEILNETGNQYYKVRHGEIVGYIPFSYCEEVER